MRLSDNLKDQKAGIDRIVELNSGKLILIDEKVRQYFYNDILLEIWSSYEDKIKGWAIKDLHTDYIAYAFASVKKCFMIPFQTLRRALKINGNKWLYKAKNNLDNFHLVKSKNLTYTTISICVPTNILLEEVKNNILIEWS